MRGSTVFFSGRYRILKQSQLGRPAHCLGARPAVESRQDVGNMHFHRTRAEDKCAGDLGVGLPFRHKLENLTLATGQVARAKATSRARPKALADWFAKRL